jgi:hypothetical protein
VRAHLAGVDDALVSVQPLGDRVADFADLLHTDADDPEFNALLRTELIGRPARQTFSTPPAADSIAPTGVDPKQPGGLLQKSRTSETAFWS